MATEVRMGKLSPTMETGTINRWLKKEGEKVSSGDTLAEVETDKASMPLETFDDGVLLKILVPEGQTAKVDDLLAYIGAPGEDVGKAKTNGGASAAKPVAVPAPAAKPENKAEVEATLPVTAPKPAPVAEQPEQPASEGRVKASPYAKKIAKELNVNLNEIRGSGPSGRIVERDLKQESAKPVAPAAAPVPITAAGTDIPLSNMRQTIARRLVQSKQSIPHFYLFADVSMDRAVQFREELNAQAGEGLKISFNDLIVKIAAAALAKHPEVNASFNQTSIHRNAAINIAVAVATEEGLYTPVLRNVDKLSLTEISKQTRELAQKARDKKLRAEDLTGSGFTISNLGMFGIDHFFAIINPPEAAIMSVGSIENKPVVNAQGQVVAGKMMGLTLSCDHRVIDGAAGAKFMATLRDLLEHPAKLLL